LVLAFTFAVAIATGIAFSVGPALQFTSVKPTEALKEAGRTSGQSGRHGIRSAIVVSQLALSMVLLVAAGLLVKSFIRLQQTELGFNPEHLLTMQVTLPATKY